MKRLLIIIVVLMASTVSAQMLPLGWHSTYIGATEPIAVEADLVAYHAPWSMPNPVGMYLIYGEIEFFDDRAVLVTNVVADLYCFYPGGCYTIRPRPVIATRVFPWSTEHHTYISMTGDPMAPQYSVLSVSLGGDTQFAMWREGTFSERGTEWVVNESTQMTEYVVTPAVTPILPYVPRPTKTEGE